MKWSLLSPVMPDLIRHPATACLRRQKTLCDQDLIALDPG